MDEQFCWRDGECMCDKCLGIAPWWMFPLMAAMTEDSHGR